MRARTNGKILVLYGNYGDGHRQAARAIREAMRLMHPDRQTVMIDFMEWIHPYLDPISRYVFIQAIRKWPSVYGYLFQKTRGVSSSSMLKTFNLLGVRRLVKLLKEVEPEIVVSTFPLAAAAMSMLKEYGWIDIPSVTVITDYTDHGYWVHSHTDQYIVGSDSVRQALNRYGISDSQIDVTGIPVRPKFSQPYLRERLQEKYGFDPVLPTLLIMGGGYGIFGEGLSNLFSLPTFPQQTQLIIVCGHNERLKQDLTNQLQDFQQRILVTGFVNNVHELMAISDLMISKSGGLTTSEAIAMELPMLLYNPLPGQEQDNAAHLLNAGVAMQANDIHDLQRKLTQLLNHPEQLRQMKENTIQLQTKRAAFVAAEAILRTTQQQVWQLDEAYLNG